MSPLADEISGEAHTEEPKFESLRQEGNIEIRRYVPVIVAETFIDGDMDSATKRGFQRIAN